MRDFLLGYLKGIGESRYRVSELHIVRGESVWLGVYGSFLSQRLVHIYRASAISAVVIDTFPGPLSAEIFDKKQLIATRQSSTRTGVSCQHVGRRLRRPSTSSQEMQRRDETQRPNATRPRK